MAFAAKGKKQEKKKEEKQIFNAFIV